MARNPESKFTDKVMRRLAREPGCFATKIHGDGRQKRGTSDVLASCYTVFFAVEIKDPNNPRSKASDLQERFLDRVNEAGGVGIVCRSLDDLEAGIGLCKLVYEGKDPRV